MPQEIAETYVPNPMLELHKALTKLLKDNNIITADQVEDQQKMAKIIDSMANVQQEILKSANNYKIKALLEHMSSDLKSIIGAAVTDETLAIINTVSGNFEAIDSNFNQLRQRIDELETNVIATLKRELQARDAQIKKDKDQIVNSLADLKNQAHCHQEANDTSKLQGQVKALEENNAEKDQEI